MLKLLFTLALALGNLTSIFAQSSTPVIVGEMRNVMWKGELARVIKLDTLTKNNLYGLGPIDYLTGEIMVLDGVAYSSVVIDSNGMLVQAKEELNAPFFAYSTISEWSEVEVPVFVKDLPSLEQFLNQHFLAMDVPFFFKLEGVFENAEIHIVNLPTGTKVKSPQDAHQGQVNYNLAGDSATLLGFFSRKHKAIFTHHDTFLHIHLITADRNKMGHLEHIDFNPNQMKLFVAN